MIAAVLIVRDESAVLERCLRSLLPHVDHFVIVDTGSQDDTLAVAASVLDGVSHEIHEREWVDFGHNRAEAIALAAPSADWLLLADADFEYEIEAGALDALPDADVLLLDVVEGSMRYAKAGLLRSGLEWSYTGRTHEVLDVGDRRTARMAGVTIRHHHDGGCRGDKFTRDLALLDGLTDPRSTFYRAQSLACLGRAEEAAAEYLARAAMGGWEEEVYYSLYRAGMLLDDVSLLLRAYTVRPERLEALYESVHRLRAAGAHEACYQLACAVEVHSLPDDVLFVEPWVWEFGIEFERALACQNTGRLSLARHVYSSLLACDLPGEYRAACEGNLRKLND